MPKNSWTCIQNINNWKSGSRKMNSLFNLINQQPGIDKIYLYANNPYDAKCQFLINKQESKRLTHLNDSKAFIEY